MQFATGDGGKGKADNFEYFLCCDWKTAWTLLYKPIDEKERKEIDAIVKVKEMLRKIKIK